MGIGTFAEALQNSDRLLFRHDGAPIEMFPKVVAGDFGLDRITALATQEPTLPVPEATLLTVTITALGVITIAVVVINRRQNITV